MPARIVERRERGVDRLDGRLDQGRRLRLAALQPAHRGGQARHRRLGPGDRLVGVAQILCRLLGLHHGGAALRERRLLPGFRRERGQFLDRMAQPVRLAGGALHLGAMRRDGRFGVAPRRPQLTDLAGLLFEPPIGVEQTAVGRGVDQRAVVVLAVDFHQGGAEALENLHADRLIVDEGARAPVGELDPPQDQFVLGRDVVVFEHEMRRVPGRHVEGGRHLPLLDTLAHQAGVAARPQRQREGVEQDRLAGAGLAREHGKAAGEIDIEPIDQHDVADREPGQHEHPVAPKWSIESSA